MSAKAIESGEGVATDTFLQEFQSNEEDEPSQSSSADSTPEEPLQGLPSESDGDGSGSTGTPKGTPTGTPKGEHWNPSCIAATVAAAVTGGVVAVGSVPVLLTAAGFTGAGIAASSLAAKMMSATAIANGGGVPAGSLVATLQSAGAAGLSKSSNILLGMAGSSLGGLAGSFLGGWFGYSKASSSSPPPDGPKAEAKDPNVGGDPPKPK
ncbi:interferon alpha-inducible protein 27-like protein 2 [Pteropus alecto]|uniref:interferon alpha-inducible protein 27-like protein 2 n=1 Tax=Pteropus alecto TaxID=9402 RepID=UPI0003F12852|nr:interferon alpha-inducible protein 27-like protein 2 [Pteropus alecto]XP_024897912.1 interferon alpha-inducible protein 27-like protein 2 [Pteropus alecto]